MSQEFKSAGANTSLDLPSTVAYLMLHNREKWLRVVLRMVQNRADAEDVLQEAALRLLGRNRKFVSPEHVRMYLGRIISNLAIDYYHLRKRDRMQHCPVREHLLASTVRHKGEYLTEEQEECNSRERLMLLLSEGLSRLPAKQYEALRLTVMDPKIISIRDAGVMNNIPYSTLRHRSLQALRRLRKFLHRTLRAAPGKLVMA